ncbi:MAG: hypothetical protein ABW090_15720 [Sedimenticola sp.]
MKFDYLPKHVVEAHLQVWELTRSRWEWGARMGHGPDHAERTYKTAMLLCEQESVDPLSVGAACYLTDAGIGDVGGRDKHIDASLALAEDIIARLPVLQDVRGTVLECIRWHEAELEPPTGVDTSVYVVRDSDTLDRLGFTGIRMTLIYGQWINRPLFNPFDPLCTENRELELDGFTLDYLRYLRSVVVGKPSTQYAKQLAEEKIQQIDAYFSAFSNLITDGCNPTYDDAYELLHSLNLRQSFDGSPL